MFISNFNLNLMQFNFGDIFKFYLTWKCDSYKIATNYMITKKYDKYKLYAHKYYKFNLYT